jgi:hypothetical protein
MHRNREMTTLSTPSMKNTRGGSTYQGKDLSDLARAAADLRRPVSSSSSGVTVILDGVKVSF